MFLPLTTHVQIHKLKQQISALEVVLNVFKFNQSCRSGIFIKLASNALLFFLLVKIYGRTAKIFLGSILRFITKEAYDQNLTHSLDTIHNASVKIVPQVVIATCVAHDTAYSQHSQLISNYSIRKDTRNSQKLGNKLASKSKTERNRVDKLKSLKKKKRKDVQKKILIGAPCEAT